MASHRTYDAASVSRTDPKNCSCSISSAVQDNLTLHRRDRRLNAYEASFETFPRLRERRNR